MADTFGKLKRVDDRTQHIVLGYIRELQNELSIRDIPPLVSYICLSFYYEGEYFLSASTEVTMSDDKMTITKDANTCGWNNTSYGNTWIESHIPQIAKWTIRTKENDRKKKLENYNMQLSGVYVFFVSHVGRENGDCTDNDDMPLYGIADDLSFVIMTRDDLVEIKNDDWRLPREQNIVMVLNTKDATISCVDGDECFVIFGNIKIGNDIKYKLAINLYCENDSVSLLDFECMICE